MTSNSALCPPFLTIKGTSESFGTIEDRKEWAERCLREAGSILLREDSPGEADMDRVPMQSTWEAPSGERTVACDFTIAGCLYFQTTEEEDRLLDSLRDAISKAKASQKVIYRGKFQEL